jgi:hypothetical protein
VKLTFSRPVHKDVPQAVAVKICNQTFQTNVLEGKSKELWKYVFCFALHFRLPKAVLYSWYDRARPSRSQRT